MDRSSSGRPGASEPLRVVVCLLSDCFAVSEPMNESSAYRALAPSETARTATISQRCSQGGGGPRFGWLWSRLGRVRHVGLHPPYCFVTRALERWYDHDTMPLV